MTTNVVIGLIILALVMMWFRQHAWALVLRWLRVLWVCRVSVASVVAGLLFFGTVAQAQDVLADTSVGLGFWIAFFILLFFGWAFPVYYAARRILDREEWGVSPHMDGVTRRAVLLDRQVQYRHPIRWVPRVLGLLCFVAVAWGIWLAKANLELSRTIPVVDMAIERLELLLAVNWLVALLFAVLIIWRRQLVAWLGSTRSTVTPVGLWESGPLWLEQLLSPAYWRASRGGTYDFVADVIGAVYAVIISGLFVAIFIDPFWIVGWSPRALFLVFMLGAWVIGLTYLAAWSHKLRAPVLLTLFFVFALVATFSPHFHDVRPLDPSRENNTNEAARRADRQLTFTEAVDRWMAANGCSRETARDCPSPIIVAGQGGASRAAFFTASVFGTMIDRSLADPTMGDFSRQVFALTTVSGSSVAAVMIRAALEDAPRDPSTGTLQVTTPCGPDRDYLWFGRTEPADKAQAAPRDSWRACLQKLTSGDFLSPVFVGLAIRDLTSLRGWADPRPWWQDRAVLLERAWENRYASLVTHKTASASPKGLEREFGYAKARSQAPAAAPLLLLNGTSVETGRRILVSDVKAWECYRYPDGKPGVRTYLQEGYDLFDVTGSESPAPIPSSDPCVPAQLASAETVVLPRSALLAAEYGHDIRLSTAGTMSARFPLISPSGILRNYKNNAVDRIVDGGYFENDGLATAADLIRLLIEQNLRPVLLHVTNEPIESKRRPTPPPAEAESRSNAPDQQLAETAWRDPRPEPSPTLPDAKEITWLQSFTTPIQGLFRTRAGHGAEAASVAVRLVEDHAAVSFCNVLPNENGGPPPCPAHYIRVAVYDHIPGRTKSDLKLSQVSMSWWLSQPVQAYLDAHLSHPLNLCSLDTLVWHVKARSAGQTLRFALPQSCAEASKAQAVTEER